LDLQINDTKEFQAEPDHNQEVATVLHQVCRALREHGYNPLDQIVGYLISGDPAYITSHHNARILIRSVERDQILDELVQNYLEREETE